MLAAGGRLLPGGPCSEPERFRRSPGQVIFSHRAANLDDAQPEALNIPREAFSEHPIALKQIAQCPAAVSLHRLFTGIDLYQSGSPAECPDWPLPATSHRTAHSGVRRNPDRNAEQLTERNPNWIVWTRTKLDHQGRPCEAPRSCRPRLIPVDRRQKGLVSRSLITGTNC